MSTIKILFIYFSFKKKKILLTQLSNTKYVTSIEFKSTNVNYKHLKVVEYEQLVMEFNCTYSKHHRHSKTLKGKYEYIKKYVFRWQDLFTGINGGLAIASSKILRVNSKFDGDSVLEISEAVAFKGQSDIVSSTVTGS